MGPAFVLIFLGVFSLAIGQAILRRKLNPYADVPWAELPEELRGEVERVLPGFHARRARITRKRDEAHVSGHYLGQELRVAGDFDREEALVEFEVDGPGGTRKTRSVSPEEVPAVVRQEFDRVLGDDRGRFQRSVIFGGSSRGESHYELKGVTADWKWEICVAENGRLIEVEKEKRR